MAMMTTKRKYNFMSFDINLIIIFPPKSIIDQCLFCYASIPHLAAFNATSTFFKASVALDHSSDSSVSFFFMRIIRTTKTVKVVMSEDNRQHCHQIEVADYVEGRCD